MDSRNNKQEFLQIYYSQGARAAAEHYGISWAAAKNRASRYNKLQIEIPKLPSETLSAEEIIDRKRRLFNKKKEAKEARKLIPIQIKLKGAIGIAHFGDPHVDDDGCDIETLEKHLALVNATEGLFAGNVGDFTNNWIGRLARLYAQQATTAKEAWVLAEWLLNACPWLYLVGGNHDAWSGAGDPLQWIAAQAGANYEPNGARFELQFPNGRKIRLNVRHEFKGHSMWNTAHGVAKAAQIGMKDHILACGHKHVSGYQVVKDPGSGLVSHALQVASYKVCDRYAEEKGFHDQNIFNCPVTIIDPQYEDNDPRQVTTIFDPENAAKYLTWLKNT